MTNFTVLAMTNNEDTNRAQKVAVIVFNEDLKKGQPIFWAMRENVIYNPHNGFKPENAKGQRLPEDTAENFMALQQEALIAFDRLKNDFQSNGGGNNSNDQIEILNVQLNAKQERIRRMAEELAELKANAANVGNNGQLDQLESMINKVAETALNQPKTITIHFNGKTNSKTAKAFHEKFEKVCKRIAKNEPIYLHGPAGTGKSELIQQAAEALGFDFYPVSTVTDDFKLTGFLDMKNDYRETQFYKAFKYGGIFFIDEMDSAAAEVLILLNAAIANRYFDFPNEFVRAHENFRVVGAGNTYGTGADNIYTGRFQLDGSTTDRFRFIKIDYSPTIERAMTNNNEELLYFVWELRRASKETDIHLLVSYRTIGRIVSGEEDEDEELPELLEECLIKGLARDDLKMLIRAMALENKNKYYSALKQIA